MHPALQRLLSILILVTIALFGLTAYKRMTTDPQWQWRVLAFADTFMGGVDARIPAGTTFMAIIPAGFRSAVGWSYVQQAGGDPGKHCQMMWSTPVGNIWGGDSDRWILDFAFREQWVERVYSHYQVRVVPDDVVLDVGGPFGSFAKYALLKGAGLVVSFEGDPVRQACLLQTFEQEIADGRFKLYPAAAWHMNDERPAETAPAAAAPEQEAADAEQDEAAAEEPAIEPLPTVYRMVPIDQAVKEMGLEKVDFINIYAEGSAENVIQGASETLKSFKPRMAIRISDRPENEPMLTGLAKQYQPEYESDSSYSRAYLY